MATEGWITVNDTELWAADSGGSGVPALLIPGGPGCADYLGPVADLLGDEVRAIRFEPRGCGRSKREGPFDVATTMADIDAMREALGIEQWLVIGHSHGASLALIHALDRPDRTVGVISLAGTGVANDRSWHVAYADARDSVGEDEPEYAGPHNMDVNRAAVASSREYFREPDLLQRVARMEVPFLSVIAGRDIRPSWPEEQIANLIPTGGIAVLPDAGHASWLTHAESLATVMRSFIAGLSHG